MIVSAATNPTAAPRGGMGEMGLPFLAAFGVGVGLGAGGVTISLTSAAISNLITAALGAGVAAVAGAVKAAYDALVQEMQNAGKKVWVHPAYAGETPEQAKEFVALPFTLFVASVASSFGNGPMRGYADVEELNARARQWAELWFMAKGRPQAAAIFLARVESEVLPEFRKMAERHAAEEAAKRAAEEQARIWSSGGWGFTGATDEASQAAIQNTHLAFTDPTMRIYDPSTPIAPPPKLDVGAGRVAAPGGTSGATIALVAAGLIAAGGAAYVVHRRRRRRGRR